jgi:hypothetical protein
MREVVDGEENIVFLLTEEGKAHFFKETRAKGAEPAFGAARIPAMVAEMEHELFPLLLFVNRSDLKRELAGIADVDEGAQQRGLFRTIFKI